MIWYEWTWETFYTSDPEGDIIQQDWIPAGELYTIIQQYPSIHRAEDGRQTRLALIRHETSNIDRGLQTDRSVHYLIDRSHYCGNEIGRDYFYVTMDGELDSSGFKIPKRLLREFAMNSEWASEMFNLEVDEDNMNESGP